MAKYMEIPDDAFDGLQMDAGILLYDFDVANATYDKKDIVTATTGGVNAVCSPEYSDFGEDVDNVQNNLLELKHLDGWTCTFGFTALANDAKFIRLALGAADIDTDNPSKIVPRRNVKTTDFRDIWWVGRKAKDGTGFAICLKNALSTDGYSLQTGKNEKGQTSVTLTGHVSIEAQDVVPMQFYAIDENEEPEPEPTPEPTPTPTPTTYTVTFDSDGGTEVESQEVEEGGKVTEPTEPTKADNTFSGWFSDAELTTEWDFDNDTVTADTTLHAKWVAN